MFERLFRGIGLPFQSFAYISKQRLWGYAIFPLIITAALVAVLSFFFWFYVISYLTSWLAVDVSHWPWIFRWFFHLFHFIVQLVLIYFFYSFALRIYLALFSIVVLPFLSPLIEKTLQAEGLTTLTFKASELFGYILETIWYSIKMVLWQAIVSLLLLFTGPLQPFLSFGFSNYFAGRSYFDMVFDLLGKPREFKTMIQGSRAEATGLGIFSSLFILIPIFGAIFAPLLAVVAATRITAEKRLSAPGNAT